MTKTIGNKLEESMSAADLATLPEWLEIVRSKVSGLSYGVVQIVVHDRKITQIERTERTRLEAPASELPRRREHY